MRARVQPIVEALQEEADRADQAATRHTGAKSEEFRKLARDLRRDARRYRLERRKCQ